MDGVVGNRKVRGKEKLVERRIKRKKKREKCMPNVSTH